jgi:hypothetical protein
MQITGFSEILCWYMQAHSYVLVATYLSCYSTALQTSHSFDAAVMDVSDL